MGFGTTAGAAILLVGILYYSASLTQGFLNAQQEVQSGVEKADARLATNRQASIQIDNKSYSVGVQELYVNVTNTGSVIFNTTQLDLILDGTVKTTSILQRTVEDRGTNVWAPDQRLQLRVTSANNPANIVVIGPNGVKDYLRG